MTLRVSAAVVATVIDHARRHRPREACGLLAAKDGVIQMALPLSNVAADPARYRLDPVEQIAAARHLRGLGLALWGVYHSHPRGPSGPSATDIDQARDVPLCHGIVALGGEQPVIRFFTPGYRRERNFETVP